MEKILATSNDGKKAQFEQYGICTAPTFNEEQIKNEALKIDPNMGLPYVLYI